ncbi:hypothetical protein [Streptacidiphilus cavernicola]|uniref:Uncharacterized protein n=1 Tax=Streptacidiphilus cavernicola TaxID=3342716 RepID=A0ABV6VT67_9ACTN
MEIQAQGDLEYLVRPEGVDTVVRVTPDVLRRVAAAVTDEAAVVDQSVRWLLERQDAQDLPPLIDLDDIAAAYPGFIDDLDRRLGEGSSR